MKNIQCTTKCGMRMQQIECQHEKYPMHQQMWNAYAANRMLDALRTRFGLMTLAWRQCCASARSQKSLRPLVDLVQNVHSDAIGVDPVLVRLAESAVVPIVCG